MPNILLTNGNIEQAGAQISNLLVGKEWNIVSNSGRNFNLVVDDVEVLEDKLVLKLSGDFTEGDNDIALPLDTQCSLQTSMPRMKGQLGQKAEFLLPEEFFGEYYLFLPPNFPTEE
jgi:hypothetical protein